MSQCGSVMYILKPRSAKGCGCPQLEKEQHLCQICADNKITTATSLERNTDGSIMLYYDDEITKCHCGEFAVYIVDLCPIKDPKLKCHKFTQRKNTDREEHTSSSSRPLVTEIEKSPRMTMTVDHITYTEKPLHGEYTHDRLWYIIKHYPQNEGEYELVRRSSLYWYYITKYGCEYNATIHKRVGELPSHD